MRDDGRPRAGGRRPVRCIALLAAIVAPCAFACCARTGPIDSPHAPGGQGSGGSDARDGPNLHGQYTDFGLVLKPPPAFRHTDYGLNGHCFATDGPGAGFCVKPVFLPDWSYRRFNDIARWDAELVDPEGKTGPIEWQDLGGNRCALRVRQTNVFTNGTELGHLPNGHGWVAVVENGEGAAISFALYVAEGTDPAPYVDGIRRMLTSVRPAASSPSR